MKDIAIFGVGGFGREVLTLIQDINKITPTYKILGFFDDGHEKGEIVNGFPVLGKIEELNNWPTPIGVAVSIGFSTIRKRVIGKIHNANVYFPTLIHPSVIIGDSNYVKIGQGCIICAGVIITTNTTIKDFVILNLQCTVGHDVVIGDYASFMPACNISGEVTIEEGVYCGTGVKFINQTLIGKYAILGAGAVVTTSIPANCTAVGVPAKVVKQNS